MRSKEAVYFAYPFRVSPPELAYQVQNSFVRPNTDQLPGAGREWFTPQNLVVARDSGMTIAWATPDAPLVTLTDINRGRWPKRLEIRNGHVFSYVMNNYWFTNYRASQGGEFTFRYAITSRRDFDEAALARFDAETRSPLVAYNYYRVSAQALRTAVVAPDRPHRRRVRQPAPLNRQAGPHMFHTGSLALLDAWDAGRFQKSAPAI